MRPLRVVLADDEPLALVRLRKLLADEPGVEIVATCADGPETITCLRDLRPDVVFLDIQMPGADGFGVLEALRPEELPWVIFVTAYDAHAIRAFEARALDYLLKPTSRTRLREAIARVRARVEAGGEHRSRLQEWLAERAATARIAVREGDRVRFIPTQSIDWVESAGNYAILHVGKTTHILRETLSELETSLPSDRFFRISRAALVRLDAILELHATGIDAMDVVLKDGCTLPLTRSRRALRDRIANLSARSPIDDDAADR